MANEKREYGKTDAQPTILYAKEAASDGDARPVLKSTSGQLFTTNGINLPVYDFVDLVVSSATETYQFRTGGTSGTLVATVTIVYTDANRSDIFTVAKT